MACVFDIAWGNQAPRTYVQMGRICRRASEVLGQPKNPVLRWEQRVGRCERGNAAISRGASAGRVNVERLDDLDGRCLLRGLPLLLLLLLHCNLVCQLLLMVLLVKRGGRGADLVVCRVRHTHSILCTVFTAPHALQATAIDGWIHGVEVSHVALSACT